MNIQLSDLVQRIQDGGSITKDEALFIASDSCDLTALLDAARQIRDSVSTKQVHRCAIVNARSGACPEDCSFCAQSSHHAADAPVYPMLNLDQLLEEAKKAQEAGVTCFGIVTSGTGAKESEVQTVISFLEGSLNMGFPCLGASLGIQPYENLKRLKDAGLRHYNHNLESSRNFYPKICTTHTWDQRFETLKNAKKAGLEICCGGIFGMGESWEDRADMAFSLAELDSRNVPLNFLSAIPGTPMSDIEQIGHEEALRVIALFRFILPKAVIRICGGRPKTFAKEQSDIFRAGASGILTGDYLTTSGNTYESDVEMIEGAGLTCAPQQL